MIGSGALCLDRRLPRSDQVRVLICRNQLASWIGVTLAFTTEGSDTGVTVLSDMTMSGLTASVLVDE